MLNNEKMAMFELHTKRLRLRPVLLDDLEALLHLWTQADICKHLWNGLAVTREQALLEIQKSMISFRLHKYGTWGIFEKNKAIMLGFAALRFNEKQKAPELLYGLLPKYRHRGFATEACRAVLSFALEELHLPYVVALTQTTNRQSIQVLTSLGFKRTGQLSRHGQIILVYSLARKDFS